ncbi:MAG: protease modulator HflK, partial [Roseiarcus sp.]
GAASRIVNDAEAYRQQTILEARGQTARYNQIYAQYKNAPGVTRERMYLETMERVLAPMSKTILDASGASAPVPYIALDPLQQKSAGAAK